ncbi:unnamed protein product [Spirodela intermedia]|uniref:Protein kinase domain-containing protein n=1 Tax=Spirodela intermedia TaxID=51605 RepID=A0A7I8JNI3_SPIIN|nr:unnamed protein product [Spirodela intermedia]CAA6671650.1 unnamed protein product [Spirodela intermedia]
MSSANSQQKRSKPDKGTNVAKKMAVVAVKASREIPRTALVWALTHVVQPGDCITLLVVVPAQSSGRKLWGFPRFAGDCASGHRRSSTGTSLEMKTDITDTCSQMMLQLHNMYDPNNINVKIKIVSGTPAGAVAAESKRAQASWVILDKQLKHEEKRCMEELQCNIVIMKRSQPKVLRLNLVRSLEAEPQVASMLLPELNNVSGKQSHGSGPPNSMRVPDVTPTSSPDLGTPFTTTEAGTSSMCSSDHGTSPFFISETKGVKKSEIIDAKRSHGSDGSSSGSDGENLSPSGRLALQPWVADILSHGQTLSKKAQDTSQRCSNKTQISTPNTLVTKLFQHSLHAGTDILNCRSDMDFNGIVWEAISLSRNAPSGPPPLCSICKHKAPVLGKPQGANFLAEGGFGSVHRGILPDGQVIAVKQHKLASSQGDHEFCAEVEVLSCAQHRNVVMLIGFCVEDQRRLLVYEYICNGSLDSHLYGCNREPVEWPARQKIAIGAARGLRYLHEECRVGCIVHRDMRPNNILLTHDFEPLVGDFGLARWQPDGDMGVETRVIGTFGYLAPEYAQSGQITDKADVYSFGVVLLELVTGRKAVDINRPKGQQCLTEWARPLLEENVVGELVDPRLDKQYSEQEVCAMLHVVSLCLRRDPTRGLGFNGGGFGREQVLRILEGDGVAEPSYLSTPRYDRGSWSGRMWTDSEKKLSCEEALRAAYREERRRPSSCEGLHCKKQPTNYLFLPSLCLCFLFILFFSYRKEAGRGAALAGGIRSLALTFLRVTREQSTSKLQVFRPVSSIHLFVFCDYWFYI